MIDNYPKFNTYVNLEGVEGISSSLDLSMEGVHSFFYSFKPLFFTKLKARSIYTSNKFVRAHSAISYRSPSAIYFNSKKEKVRSILKDFKEKNNALLLTLSVPLTRQSIVGLPWGLPIIIIPIPTGLLGIEKILKFSYWLSW